MSRTLKSIQILKPKGLLIFTDTCNLKHKLERKAYAFKNHKLSKKPMSIEESFMIKSLINLSPQFFKLLNWKYNPIAVLVFLV